MEFGKLECQMLNNVGVGFFERGRFGDARKVFVAALQVLKQEDAKTNTQSTRRRTNHAAKYTTWSNACATVKSDADFVWTRALRVPSHDCCPLETTTLVAIMTFNFALCLHMTSITNNKSGLIQWTIRIYKTVVRLLKKTCGKLSDRIKVAVYNNVASLQCRLLDYCAAFRWYTLLSKHMNSCDKEDHMVDRGNVILNIILCCTPTVAGAA